MSAPWNELHDAQAVLAAHLNAVPAVNLHRCHSLAQRPDSRTLDNLDAEVRAEVNDAIARLRAYADDLAAQARTQLSKAE